MTYFLEDTCLHPSKSGVYQESATILLMSSWKEMKENKVVAATQDFWFFFRPILILFTFMYMLLTLVSLHPLLFLRFRPTIPRPTGRDDRVYLRFGLWNCL